MFLGDSPFISPSALIPIRPFLLASASSMAARGTVIPRSSGRFERIHNLKQNRKIPTVDRTSISLAAAELCDREGRPLSVLDIQVLSIDNNHIVKITIMQEMRPSFKPGPGQEGT